MFFIGRSKVRRHLTATGRTPNDLPPMEGIDSAEIGGILICARQKTSQHEQAPLPLTAVTIVTRPNSVSLGLTYPRLFSALLSCQCSGGRVSFRRHKTRGRGRISSTPKGRSRFMQTNGRTWSGKGTCRRGRTFTRRLFHGGCFWCCRRLIMFYPLLLDFLGLYSAVVIVVFVSLWSHRTCVVAQCF